MTQTYAHPMFLPRVSKGNKMVAINPINDAKVNKYKGEKEWNSNKIWISKGVIIAPIL